MGTFILTAGAGGRSPCLLAISFLTVAMLRLVPGDPAASLAGGHGDPGADRGDPARPAPRTNRSMCSTPSLCGDVLRGNLGRSLKTNRLVADELCARGCPATAKLAARGDALCHDRWHRGRHRLGGAAEHMGRQRDHGGNVVTGYSFPSFWVGISAHPLFRGATTLVALHRRRQPRASHPAGPHARFAARRRDRPPDTVAAWWRYCTSTTFAPRGRRGCTGRTVFHAPRPEKRLYPRGDGDRLADRQSARRGGNRGGDLQLARSRHAGESTAINSRDYPMVQGVVLLAAVTFVMINLFVDLLYGFLDPRIRYE